MLRYGIPSYRFPREIIDKEIENILSVGINVKLGVDIGKDITIKELSEKYDAVYISIGAQGDKKLRIEGEDSTGVMSAVQMLGQIGDDIMPDFKGKKVVIVGGGNVAMDVTRTSVRLGAESVTCVYRRRKEDMTALPEEVEGALAEGAEIVELEAPVRIESENGKVTALITQPQIIGAVGRDYRPRPQNANLPEKRIETDIIVMAVGQNVEDIGFEEMGIETNWGNVVTDSDTKVNNTPNVFAGGDCVSGPATAIKAVAAGKIAAANIDNFLGFNHEISVDVEIPAPKPKNHLTHGRVNIREREANVRKNDFEHIECKLTKQEAEVEANRCLRCDHYGYGCFKGGRKLKW
jgi:NADPH-dependent glutamate synthase beta subunit-like oxidoreductase